MKKLTLHKADLGYNSTTVLRDISVTINEGDIFLIEGANGSGKTTLAKALLGLLPLKKGNRKTGFQRMAYIPQQSILDRQYPLTLKNLVAMGLPGYHRLRNLLSPSMHRNDRILIDGVMERVGLSGKKENLFSEVSGGELQRALAARALISSPDFILLDEPFANIDRYGRDDLKLLLLQEHDENITLVIIDHHDHVDFNTISIELCGGSAEGHGCY